MYTYKVHVYSYLHVYLDIYKDNCLYLSVYKVHAHMYMYTVAYISAFVPDTISFVYYMRGTQMCVKAVVVPSHLVMVSCSLSMLCVYVYTHVCVNVQLLVQTLPSLT